MGNSASSSFNGEKKSSTTSLSHQLPFISLPNNSNSTSTNKNNPISLNPLYYPYYNYPSVIQRTACDAASGGSPPPLLPPPPSSPSSSSSESNKVSSDPPPPPSAPPLDAPGSTSSTTTSTTTTKGSSSSPESDAIAQAAANSSPFNNPGPYEALSMDAKRLVALDTFEGFRCDVNKQMSPGMIVIHSFGLNPSGGGGGGPPPGMGPPPPPPSSYTFITQVGDENGIFVSRVDTARGGVDARMQRVLLGGLAMFKLQMSLSNSDHDTLLAELDVGTTIPTCTWTANVKYGSMGGGPVWGANYWQAITPQLTMGGEGMYIAAQGTPAAAYAFKYNFQAPLTPQERQDQSTERATAAAAQPGAPPPEVAGASSIIGNFHSNGLLTLNYRRVVTPQRVVVGSELAFPLMAALQETPDLMVGAEFNLSRSKLMWSLDCNSWKMSSILETKLGMSPMAPRFTLSAAVDHLNQDFKFGYSINIDG